MRSTLQSLFSPVLVYSSASRPPYARWGPPSATSIHGTGFFVVLGTGTPPSKFLSFGITAGASIAMPRLLPPQLAAPAVATGCGSSSVDFLPCWVTLTSNHRTPPLRPPSPSQNPTSTGLPPPG